MARYAVVDNGVVVGVLSAPTAPVLNIPPYRQFIDITEGPDVRGGELYDPNMGAFLMPELLFETALQLRVMALESKTADLTKAVDDITATKTPSPILIEPPT